MTSYCVESTFYHMKKPVQLPKVEPVTLPTILGVRPGIYILILGVLLIALVLFLVGCLPGILNGGKKVTFTSPLTSVAVTIDGVYKGATPFEIFVESGDHEISFSKDGVVLQTKDVRVGHPVFFSWLFPRKQTVENDALNITRQGIDRLTEKFLDDLAGWSTVTDYDDRYHFPPLYTNWATDMTVLVPEISDGSATSVALRKEISDAWTLACAHITSKTLLDDASAAKETLLAAGLLQDTATADRLLAVAGRLFTDQGSLTDMVGLAAGGSTAGGDTGANQTSALTVPGLSIDGFTYFPETFVMGDAVPEIWPAVTGAGVDVSTGAFSIAATEVTEYQWALFVEQNPYWSKANLSQLVADGMSDDYYLAGIFPSTAIQSSRPIRNISYYAAQAFCEWLSGLSGKNVHLPTEEQWTRAALSVQGKEYTKALLTIDMDTTAPSAMLGGVWEFTSTRFIPLARVSGAYVEIQRLADAAGLSTDMVVKGGSYINSPTDIGVATVGTADRAACGEYTGMRIVWE